ncbi:MAG: FHA domain-containing protein, partial [Gammaproteobacteria bacterium]
SLRRLADETGGQFVLADAEDKLPAAFLDAPYEVLDNVGEVHIPKPAEGWPAGANPRRLSLELTTSSGKVSATAMIDFPQSSSAVAGQRGEAQSQPAGTLGALPGFGAGGNERTLLYILIVAGLLAVVLGASAMWLPSRRSGAQEAGQSGAPDANRARSSRSNVLVAEFTFGADEGDALPDGARQRHLTNDVYCSGTRTGDNHHPRSAAGANNTGPSTVVPTPLATASKSVPVEESAFLKRMGEQGDAYPMLSSPSRIGRQSDNDVVLKHASISRHHAVVERNGPGEYVIRDLGALNGVIVNGMRKPEAVLADGDLIKLGDVMIKFGLEIDETNQVAEPASESQTLYLHDGSGADSKGAALSLANFGDTDEEEDGLDFMGDDQDGLRHG